MDPASLLNNTDKGLFRIVLPVYPPDLFLLMRLIQKNMAGCQNAPDHLDRRRRKVHWEITERLGDLRPHVDDE